MKVIFVLLAVLPQQLFSADSDDQLIRALIIHESGGDNYAIGDRNLRNKAYGCLQIRQPCVDDVKRRFPKKFSHDLKAEDMLGNPRLSIRVFGAYVGMWATKRRLGKEQPTYQDKARIWNGGPNGWRRHSTKRYWKKVEALLKKK